MKDGKLRGAFVGCGAFAWELMRQAWDAVPGVEAVACSDPDRGKRDRFAAGYGLTPYGSVTTLAGNEDVDVYVVSRPADDVAALLGACRPQSGVLCAAPGATTLAAHDALASLAETRDVA